MSPSESVPSSSGAGVALPSGSFDPQSVEGLFLAALQKSPEQRAAFLDEVCSGDEDRRRRIAALLRAYEDAGSFLETPAGGKRPDPTSHEIRLDFLAPTDKPGCLGTIGPYEVIDVIGRGGMGIVLRALDPKLNRIVAVKVLAPELAVNPNARRRFIREAQAAASISHPHVVTIHAVDDGGSSPAADSSRAAPSLPFLVMECVVGQSLQDKLDRAGSLRLTEILRIGHQIACGLAAAHKQGLIHRDIKPANILLENGVERVKITDFGLARLVDDVAITRTGEVSGTPQYMSPEQAKGERVDHRSDLFSLGCVLYAMCTGHSPFRGDSLAHVIKRVTQDEPRPIDEQNPEVPRWLSEIISRLLEKTPDRRIQTADELADLLGEHLARVQHAEAGSGLHVAINKRHFGDSIYPTARAPRQAMALFSAAGDRRSLLLRWTSRLGGLLVTLGAGTVVLAVGAGIASVVDPIQFGRPTVQHAMIALGGFVLLIAGALLRLRRISSETLLVVLFLTLGPVGLVLWLLLRERWERAIASPIAGAEPESPPVAEQRVSPGAVKANRLRRIAQCLLWSGATFVFMPFVFFWIGGVIDGRGIMEFGEQVGRIAGPLGVVCAGVAAVLWIVARLIDDSPLSNVHETGGAAPGASRPAPSPWRALGWALFGMLLLGGVSVVAWIVVYLMSYAGGGTLVLSHPLGVDVEEVLLDGRRASTVHNLTDVEIPHVSAGMHLVEVKYRDAGGTQGAFQTQVHVREGQDKSLYLALPPEPDGVSLEPEAVRNESSAIEQDSRVIDSEKNVPAAPADADDGQPP